MNTKYSETSNEQLWKNLDVMLDILNKSSIKNKNEHLRFFLKLLKSSINNYHLSAELVPRKDNEDFKLIYNGKTEKFPRINIFKNSFELEHVPEMVVLDKLNSEILQAYNKTQQTVVEIKKKVINRNRWIAGLILLQIIILVARCIHYLFWHKLKAK